MIKSFILVLCTCLLLAGCITSQTSSGSHHERVSREIAEILARAEQDASIGDNIKITARPGQTLVIGGDTSSDENVANALLGYSKMGEMKETLITVTHHIR